MNRLILIAISLGLGGCAGGYDLAHYNVVNNVHDSASWQDFLYCGGWGCSRPQDVLFAPEEWAQVETIMQSAAATPEAERAQVAEAIGLMELLIAPKTGHGGDLAGTASGFSQRGQLDCYSEAANTSNFLWVLHNAGLLRHHTPADPIMRGMAAGKSWRPTHATATMAENLSGELYAMDSWFFDNGHSAVYVDAATWGGAWAPSGGASF